MTNKEQKPCNMEYVIEKITDDMVCANECPMYHCDSYILEKCTCYKSQIVRWLNDLQNRFVVSQGMAKNSFQKTLQEMREADFLENVKCHTTKMESNFKMKIVKFYNISQDAIPKKGAITMTLLDDVRNKIKEFLECYPVNNQPMASCLLNEAIAIIDKEQKGEIKN